MNITQKLAKECLGLVKVEKEEKEAATREVKMPSRRRRGSLPQSRLRRRDSTEFLRLSPVREFMVCSLRSEGSASQVTFGD